MSPNPSATADDQASTVKTYSLSRRIIAAVITCQILLAIGLSLVAVLYARQQLSGSVNAAIEGQAMAALALVRYTETKPPILIFDAGSLPPAESKRHPDLYEIRAADGHLIARSSSWTQVPGEVAGATSRYTDFTFAGAPYRAVLLRNVPVLDQEEEEENTGPTEKVTVVFASSLTQSRERLLKLATYVGLTSLLLLLIANAVAIWSIRRGLEPLEALAVQAGEISVHNWGFRAPSDAKLARELAPLTEAIEAVLGRLKESFRQQRDFTNDAAHELKTSVAIVKSTLQSLLHRPRSHEQYREGLESALEDCARLEDLLNRMLRLARVEQRTENGVPRETALTELTSTCEAAVSRMRTVASERRVTLEFDSPGAIFMRADPEDLELLWLTLIENAVQYSPEGSNVQLRVRDEGHSSEISVVDSGPGIADNELPYIFERFRRGDRSRARSTGGFGLGLAICKALVNSYGGSIEAINLPGRGTQMRVHLPTDAQKPVEV